MVNSKYAFSLESKHFLKFFQAYYDAVVEIKKLYKPIPKEWQDEYQVMQKISSQK